MNKYIFKITWCHKFSSFHIHVIEFSIVCNDEQFAREAAFEQAMRIHKNMCESKKDFKDNWYYSSTRLVQVIPNYR